MTATQHKEKFKRRVRFQEKTTSKKENAKSDNELDYIPYTVILVKSIQGISIKKPLLALLDSGATNTFIRRDAIPEGVKIEKGSSITSSTLGCTFTSNDIM